MHATKQKKTSKTIANREINHKIRTYNAMGRTNMCAHIEEYKKVSN